MSRKTKQDERSIEQATTDLGVHYKAWKSNEALKDADKKRFFALITKLCASDYEPDQILVAVTNVLTLDEASARAEKYNPRYCIDESREAENGFEFIMLERPEFMPFLYVNVADEMVYQRQVTDGSQVLDDDRLQVEDPGLYKAVTFELPWGVRMVRPFDSLTPEQLGAISDYIYRGKPTVKLPAPRPAKDEELAEVADVS